MKARMGYQRLAALFPSHLCIRVTHRSTEHYSTEKPCDTKVLIQRIEILPSPLSSRSPPPTSHPTTTSPAPGAPASRGTW